MQLDSDYVPGAKLGLHCLQIIVGFVIFILEIILFRADNAVINGNNGWPFGLCFLSIPAIIFLVMAPRWERTQRLAEPHAMAVVDAVFAVFWLSAFASQAAYNTANSCGDGCSVSKAIVGMAFFELLFWVGSSIISGYTLKYYQNNGTLPGYDKITSRNNHQNIDPDKAAFSMAPHDEEAYAPIHADEHDEHDDHHGDGGNAPFNADSYNAHPMFDSETDYRSHSTTPGPQPGTGYNDNTEYGGAAAHNTFSHNDPYSSGYGSQPTGGNAHIYAPPSAEEYDESRPAQFPAGNYDRTMH